MENHTFRFVQGSFVVPPNKMAQHGDLVRNIAKEYQYTLYLENSGEGVINFYDSLGEREGKDIMAFVEKIMPYLTQDSNFTVEQGNLRCQVTILDLINGGLTARYHTYLVSSHWNLLIDEPT